MRLNPSVINKIDSLSPYFNLVNPYFSIHWHDRLKSYETICACDAIVYLGDCNDVAVGCCKEMIFYTKFGTGKIFDSDLNHCRLIFDNNSFRLVKCEK